MLLFSFAFLSLSEANSISYVSKISRSSCGFEEKEKPAKMQNDGTHSAESQRRLPRVHTSGKTREQEKGHQQAGCTDEGKPRRIKRRTNACTCRPALSSASTLLPAAQDNGDDDKM